MSARAECDAWERLGIPCPTHILEENKKRRKERAPFPAEPPDQQLEEEAEAEVGERNKVKKEVDIPPFFVGDKLKKEGQVVSMEEWEALLLEIARRAASKEIGNPRQNSAEPSTPMFHYEMIPLV